MRPPIMPPVTGARQRAPQTEVPAWVGMQPYEDAEKALGALAGIVLLVGAIARRVRRKAT